MIKNRKIRYAGGPEHEIVEMPIVHYLAQLGYHYLRPEENDLARDGLNQVILRQTFLSSIMKINNLAEDDARSVYHELLTLYDNEKWTYILRGNYSKTIRGRTKKKTIHLIDFLHPGKNTFTVTNQFHVQAEKTRIADVVCFINGIPICVIEAKSPVSFKNKMGQAFEQIKEYEQDIPRLFYSNMFNIITNGVELLYGATAAPSAFWGEWKDPYPATKAGFRNNFEKGLYCLLKQDRLLDILAHFIVFQREKQTGRLIKKICRYQQYRAVNKIVKRFLEDRPTGQRKGLIWHTQGSGKSLTMVFTVLKLKKHLNIVSEKLTSPNILVVTDRVDLDDQISGTFKACALPNPTQVGSIPRLYKEIHKNTTGLTLLSTIFKFESSTKPVKNSNNWILLIDESHRTQERDLGAYLRATFPAAYFFGFTGTPVQNTAHNTYRNFSPRGELYLDKYSIDDAVADGATVPIHYTSRKTEWHLEGEKLDILFDQWFANETDAARESIKKQGIKISTLAKHPRRVELIAYDIWNHYQATALPDGYKAQLVAIDREHIILYKRELDKIITEHFISQGLSPHKAARKADEISVCVYSPSQEDAKPSEDPFINQIRKELLKYQLNDDKVGKWAKIKSGEKNRSEKEVKDAFKIKGKPPYFLIVCAKLLTGFDAPCESVMYLDSPLKEHNLLQAIARTNRVEGPNKQNGLIVDYIGVTKNLNQALSTYRKEDIKNALHTLDELHSNLKAAHRQVIKFIKNKWGKDINKDEIKKEYDELIQALGSLDVWLTFKEKAKAFIRAYEALSPEPAVLNYRKDMKWVAGFIGYATLSFEKSESPSLKNYSAKIRTMLAKHLQVTGLSTLLKLKKITDPDFHKDFDTKGKPDDDLKTAAVRKATELKKIITEKMAENPLQYISFSKRVLELISRFEQGLLTAAQMLKQEEQLANDIITEDNAYKKSGLNKNAHGVYKILQAFIEESALKSQTSTEIKEKTVESSSHLNKLQKIAKQIDTLYTSTDTAPVGWHLKEQLKKELRQKIRRIIIPAGFKDWKRIPVEIETYALKNYVRIV
jgi:type I restriction enzyme R subunit